MRPKLVKIAAIAVLVGLLNYAVSYYLFPLIFGSKNRDTEVSRTIDTTEFFASLSPYLEDGTSRSHRDRFKRMVSKALYVALQYHIDEPDEHTLFDGAMRRVEALGLVRGGETPDRLIEVVIDGMLSAMDPYSGFLPKEAFAEIKSPKRSSLGGIGIELTMQDDRFQIVSPIDETPAARAGLRAGDIITRVDGRSLSGLTFMQVLERMRGEPGASVGLSIERGGAEPFDVTLTRALIKLEPLWVSVEGSTGYIRIVSFEKDIHDRLGPAYDTLHDRLGERLNGFVLDLRNNSGGWQDQAVAVADDFLNDGVILTSHARWSDGVERFRANDGDITNNVPMVILINEGTASAAEIVASALQDNGRAVVMGRRSHGKGTMQSIYPMPYKTAIRLTTHRHYAPSGRSFDANGVVPDVAIIRERPDRATGTYDDTQVLSPAAVSEDRCPPGGAHVDRVLGCAIALVEAGSLEDFLAQFGR